MQKITSKAKPRSKTIVTGITGIAIAEYKYEIAVLPEITAVATYESSVIVPATDANVLDEAFKRQLYAPPLVGNASTTSVYTDL